MIESIEVLQTNRQRYCVVSKMRYLGEAYDINALYNGRGKIFLEDTRLKDIEPIQHVLFRIIAYSIFIMSSFSTILSNLANLKKRK